jgi:hypothetical protein
MLYLTEKEQALEPRGDSLRTARRIAAEQAAAFEASVEAAKVDPTAPRGIAIQGLRDVDYLAGLVKAS